MKDLFKGVAVVIDDEVNDPNANINKIIDQIKAANIPVVEYDKLPEKKDIDHFQNLSFLLLDWRLIKENVSNEDIDEGLKVPDGLQEYDAEENLQFIGRLNKKCFCPVFIFTNESTSAIITKLKDNGLVEDDRPSNLFVQSKSDLQDEGALLEKVSKWLKDTPSIYVLKEWEREYQICKTKLFSDLHSINPSWPIIMWKNFEADGANKSLEMGELISRNLHSRMTPFAFDNDILAIEGSVPGKNELRQVLEGERFLKIESLHKNDIGTGDVFKEESQENGETKVRYYLNIRAQCDLVREVNPNLFLLSGYVLKQKGNGKIKDIPFHKGQYIEKHFHAVVAFIDEGKIIEFKFNELLIERWKDIKGKRVGRLLPPYINKIQQRYSLYMQRQGVPRIPGAAI